MFVRMDDIQKLWISDDRKTVTLEMKFDFKPTDIKLALTEDAAKILRDWMIAQGVKPVNANRDAWANLMKGKETP